MPTERVGDLLEYQACDHADHWPSTEFREVGKYRHTCPGCGRVLCFTLANPHHAAWPAGATEQYLLVDP